MNVFKKSLVFLCLVANFYSANVSAHSRENYGEDIGLHLKKVYITHDQIRDQIEVADNEMLFYNLEAESPYLIQAISYDKGGLYVELSLCKHRPKCRKCRGCFYYKNCVHCCTCIK